MDNVVLQNKFIMTNAKKALYQLKVIILSIYYNNDQPSNKCSTFTSICHLGPQSGLQM